MRCRSLAFLAVLLMVPIAALAQTNPFDGLNTGGRAYLDPSVYAQQKAQWLARVDAMPETDLPAMAFDTGDMTKARSYAEQLLTEVGSDRSQWNYGDAVHKGNLILGRIAVREGRLAEAVTFLRASGDTPGSGVLNSFGPNMSLAKDLLERGEVEAVLNYFESCRLFWKMGGARLDAWSKDVQAGHIPNFGANLRY
jgi:hypothetical protein